MENPQTLGQEQIKHENLKKLHNNLKTNYPNLTTITSMNRQF